jgi:oxygen-independent coproporphyrinogen-3 oxidase
MPTTHSEPFGVYIHWPFCARKCPYCDFNSHVRHAGWDEPRFLATYKRELSFVGELLRIGTISSPLVGQARGCPGLDPGRGGLQNVDRRNTPNPIPPHKGEGDPRTVTSVFFGGGTPSLMKPETIAAILDHIASLWPIDDNAEITLEANPDSVEAARFAGYRAAGVNRVSIGVQSLRDEELRRLGRLHTANEARAAVEIAARTFDRFSFDLIYARPGETPPSWHDELTQALALAGDHISLYQLTIEPGTPYAALHAAGKLAVPDPDTALALYEITQELTEAHGLPAYEISNHAAPGEESRHNLLYWRYGEYAGIGPGAHGRLIVGGARHATLAVRNPETWVERVETVGHGFTEMTPLSPAEQADEMLLMGLRLSEGLDLDRLAHIGGVRPCERTIATLESQNFIERIATPVPSSRRRPGARSPGRLDLETCLDPVRSLPRTSIRGPNDVCGSELDHPDDIRACIGPGLAPPTGARLRATQRARFVLNALVAELAAALEPVSAPPVAAHPDLG